MLTSDHGHHDTPYSLAVDELLAAHLDVRVLLADEDDTGREYVERFRHYSPARVVVTVAGARQASLHLRTSEDWGERPTAAEILAFPRRPEPGGQSAVTLPRLLCAQPAIQLVAVRAADGARLFGRAGSSAIERVPGTSAADASFRYRVLEGADPLGYDADARTAELLDGRAHSSREWLAASAHHAHPDAVPQLAAAFESERAGDVLVFAAPSWDFSAEFAGGHGGLLAEEMLVPLLLAGPRIPRGVELECARLVDVVPTLLALRGADVPPDLDGSSLVEALAALAPPRATGAPVAEER